MITPRSRPGNPGRCNGKYKGNLRKTSLHSSQCQRGEAPSPQPPPFPQKICHCEIFSISVRCMYKEVFCQLYNPGLPGSHHFGWKQQGRQGPGSQSPQEEEPHLGGHLAPSPKTASCHKDRTSVFFLWIKAIHKHRWLPDCQVNSGRTLCDRWSRPLARARVCDGRTCRAV